ncbi:MAG: TatD family hydrolase [Armatimonadaceae bacterium]
MTEQTTNTARTASLLDTHVHFNHDVLGKELPDVIRRAEAVGVERFVVVGFDLPSSEKAVAQAEADSRIYAVVGVHPHSAKEWNAEAAARLREWAQHPRVVAIGEIGLDFYRDLSPRSDQYRAFREQLALAGEVGMPVVIHCRDAYPETLDLLESEAGDTPILLHCFAGSREDAERAWAHGWYLGVGGTVTFKRNTELREIVRDAPETSLLLETDAPYLTPEPHRGKFPNEPRYIPLVAACIASTRSTTTEQVARFTTANAERFFPRLAYTEGIEQIAR